VALAGLVLALVGFAVVGPPLSAPGAVLCLLGGLAELSVRLAARGVTLTARQVDGTVIEGEPLSLELVVSGSWLLGLGGPQLRHPLLEGSPALRAVSTPVGRGPDPRRGAHGARTGARTRRSWTWGPPARQVQIRARTRRRGRMVLAAPRLELSDPLGLARARCGGGAAVGELLVLPRAEPVPWLTESPVGVAVATASARAGREAGEITGLRDYQPGTPASRIHWPALAHGGDLLERVFAGETQPAPLVVIDARTAESWSGLELLDVTIRAVASLSLALARAGAVDLQLPGRGVPVRIGASLSAWPAAHRALALVVEAPPGGPAPEVPRDNPGVLFYAAGDPALAAAAARRWNGPLWTLTPRLPGASLLPGAVECAGCVLTPPVGGA
jgi:uncharacterized protein (DUF58 family)